MQLQREEKLRAWWSHRQGLDGRFENAGAASVAQRARRAPPNDTGNSSRRAPFCASSLGDVLEQTGWARSVGGVNPYLTLFARAGISREGADAAVSKLEIHELPAARGCTYVVPASDFALALRAGESFSSADMKTAYKLGVTDKEVEKLCGAVLKALAKGPLEPDEIREAAGSASRSLGEEGKKKGLTTTLPLALGKLQASGDIRRVPVNGRLDQQRYRYTLWRPNPLAKFKMSEEEVATELARRYFTWIGPATIAEFQWFSALSVKASKAAMEPLKLENIGGDRFLLPEHREQFESFKVPKQAQYTMIASIDGISLLRRDLKGITDASDLVRKVYGDKGIVTLGGIADLPSHAIVDRGRLIGLWEYDPGWESIVWVSFIPKNKDLEKAVARTEEYVRTQLGDARSFSLDSPKSRVPKIEALRKASK